LRLEAGDVCFEGKSGKHMLALRFSGFDPTETLAVRCGKALMVVSASIKAFV
jgi:hypothetical protein